MQIMLTAARLFTSLRATLSKHRVILIALAVLFGLVLWQLTYAQVPGTATFNQQVGNLMLAALAWVFAAIAQTIGWLVTSFIGLIVIPILGYNGFGDSFIISVGWPLMRDLVNMFVIVILIYIAIKTMLGIGGGAQAAQQQILRLFMAVVLVNFSKTICLIAIDFSQVVMFTFVNALRDIAAGNFVQLFQLNSMLSWTDMFSLDSEVAARASADALGYLATSYMTVVLMSIVAATLVILLIIYIYRIIVLWFLIILAPIAFFVKGAGGLLGGMGGSVWSQWEKTFFAALAIGPMMTFFLWLSLAAVSRGASLASSEGFMTGAGELDSANLTGFLTEVFHIEQLLSLMLGVAILIMGIQISAQTAGALGGVAKQAADKLQGWSRSLITMPATLTAAGAGKAGRFGLQQVERRTGIGSQLGRDISREGARLQQVPGLGFLGRGVSATGAGLQKAAGTYNKEARAESRKRVADFSDAQFAGYAQVALSEGNLKGQFASLSNKDDIMETLFQVLTNKDKEKALADELMKTKGLSKEDAKKEVGTIKKNAMTMIHANVDDYIGDDKDMKEKWFNAQARNLHLVPAGDVQKIVDDEKFKAHMLNGDTIASQAVRDAMKKKVVRTETQPDGTEKKVSMLDDVEAGKGVGQDVRDFFGSGAGQAQKITDFMNASEVDIAKALKYGKNKPSDITAANAFLDHVQKGLLASGVGLEGMDAATQQYLRTHFENTLQNTPTSPRERAQMEQAIYSIDKDPVKAFGIQPDGKLANASSSIGLTNQIRNDVNMTIVTKLPIQQDPVTNKAKTSDVTKAALEAANKDMFTKLKKEFDDLNTDPKRRTEIEGIFGQYKKVFEAEETAGNLKTKGDKRKHDDFKAISRYIV